MSSRRFELNERFLPLAADDFGKGHAIIDSPNTAISASAVRAADSGVTADTQIS